MLAPLLVTLALARSPDIVRFRSFDGSIHGHQMMALQPLANETCVLLRPFGGLCNRLRTVLSAMVFEQQHPNVRFFLDWQPAHNCPGQWTDLFSSQPFLGCTHPTEFQEVCPGDGNCDAKSCGGYTRWPQKYPVLPPPQRSTEMNACFLFKPSEQMSDERFLTALGKAARTLIPTATVQQEVDKTLDLLKAKTVGPAEVIGVHVRVGDAMDAKEASKGLSQEDAEPFKRSLNLYTESVDGRLKQRPNATIFLATDTEAIQHAFDAHYPGQVVVQRPLTGKVTRDTATDTVAALVDLLILGQTTSLVGTTKSSFTFIASLLGTHNFTHTSAEIAYRVSEIMREDLRE